MDQRGEIKLLYIIIISFVAIFSITSVEAITWDNVAYYKLDGTSGVVIDSASSNNGTNDGANRGVTGILGNAFEFDNDTDSILLSNPTSSTVFSTSFWFNLSAYPSGSGRELVSKAGSPGNEPRWGILILDGETDLKINMGSDNTWRVISNTSLNSWNHVVLTYNGTHALVYFNGTETLVFATTFTGSTAIVDLGEGLFTDTALKSKIDENGWWNRTLNDSEVSDLYNNGDGLVFGSGPPLVFENATFENVNVTNNIIVEENVTATYGFFDFFGSSISRIMNGWFTDLDVSGITNITGETYLLNTTCSSGQVLTTNANGLVVCTDVVDIKSGFTNVTEDVCTSITFNTNFSSTPIAVGNVQNGAEDNVVSIGTLSTSGFDLCLEKVGGGATSTYTVYWTATNVGNP